MSEKQSHELSDQERDAFQQLREQRFYSLELENQLVKNLKQEGFFKTFPKFVFPKLLWLTTATALLALTFLMGVYYGRQLAPSPSPPVEQTETHKVRPIPDLDHTRDCYVASKGIVLDDYRDEPDRPGNGNDLYAKTLTVPPEE